MIIDRKDLVIVEMSDGFCIRDMSVSHTEFHQWGYLCSGCPTREDAEQFIAEYITKEHERAKRMKEPDDDEPPPWDADGSERGSKP